MELIAYQLRYFGDLLISLKVKLPDFLSKNQFQTIMYMVRSIGLVKTMEEYDQRKLSIFNQINFFQLITGICMPVLGLVSSRGLPLTAWLVACLPAMVSALVLYLNKIYKHESALITYFVLYPFITCIVYLYGLNLGIDLYFILYGLLAVFFLKDIGYIIFSLGFSMVSYFILSVVLNHFWYNLQELNNNLFLLNHGVALLFIFYGLFLIKNENTGYQHNILSKNRSLQQKNIQIQHQTKTLKENAFLLKKQAAAVSEMDRSKNKLFSIISHDLKTPVYTLRNLFTDIHHQKMGAGELEKLVPDVLNELNYTAGLLDNLLQWAKAQMQANSIHPVEVEIEKSVNEALQLLHLQAKAKKITVLNDAAKDLYGFADKDMINLVLRNLLSNAVKFTPRNGLISIGIHEHHSFLEIYIQDSGPGISTEALAKISNNDYYTTKGTANETGTGLGLMLCKDFLARNGGQLHIESEPGKGSLFSFTVPKPV